MNTFAFSVWQEMHEGWVLVEVQAVDYLVWMVVLGVRMDLLEVRSAVISSWISWIGRHRFHKHLTYVFGRVGAEGFLGDLVLLHAICDEGPHVGHAQTTFRERDRHV